MNKKAIIALLSALVLTVVASVTLILTVGRKASADTESVDTEIVTVPVEYLKIDSEKNWLTGFTEDGENWIIGKQYRVEVPSGVVLIGYEAFRQCEGLVSVAIPTSVTGIGGRAFIGCDGLESITIPSNVTSLSSYAFANCKGLKSVRINGIIETMQTAVFNGCTNLQTVDFAVKRDLNITSKWKSGWVDDSVTVNWGCPLKVVFDDGDGNTIETQYCGRGTLVRNPPDLTKSGYGFLGWKLDGQYVKFESIAGEEVSEIRVEDDMTLVAEWRADPVVVFDTDGGSEIAQRVVSYNTTISKPVNPTKTGYTCLGWQLNGQNFDFNTPITEDITLVAQWIKNPVVTFNTNGGNAISPRTVVYNTTTYSTTPRRTGYKFLGWQLNGQYFNFNTPITENIELVAQWEKLMKVTFDYNYDSNESVQYVESGKCASKHWPSRTGYEVTEWLLNGEPYNFSTPVTEDITLVAQWGLVTYSVYFYDSYYRNGEDEYGRLIDEQQVTYGSQAVEPEEPTREGYGLLGWYCYNNGESFEIYDEWDYDYYNNELETYGVLWNFDDPVEFGYDVYFYAKWGELYTVTFITNGGNSVANQKVVESCCATKPTPTRDGYDFVGWYIDDEHTFDFTQPIYENKTLVAKWTIKKFKVTFDSNNNTNPTEVTVDWNTLVDQPADPEKDGCVFLGWKLNDATFNFSTAITADVTLVANWGENPTVTFVTFNDDGGNEMSQCKVIYNTCITKPADPIRDGYTFMGWYKEGGEEFDFNAPVAESLTLTAGWMKSPIVTFNTDGGNEISARVVAYNTVIMPVTPVKTGYKFLGWKLNGETFDFGTQIVTDIELTAQWEKLMKVTFNSNGGYAVEMQYVENGQHAYSRVCGREHYDFKGWKLGENDFDFNTMVVTSDIELVAQWELSHYNVVFDSNGAGDVATQSVEYGSSASEPTDPTRDEYFFCGWYVLGDNGGNYTVTEYEFDQPVTADIILTAVWKKIYNVKFISVSGEVYATAEVVEGEVVKAPVVKLNGYSLKDWYNGEETYDFNTPVTDDLTLTAQWEVVSEPETTEPENQETPTEQENTEVKANKNNVAVVAAVAGTSGVAGVTAIGTIVGVVLKKRRK